MVEDRTEVPLLIAFVDLTRFFLQSQRVTDLELADTLDAFYECLAVPVEKAGVGAAVLNACRQVGGSVGIALMVAIMASAAGGQANAERLRSGGAAARQLFVDGFMRGFERSLLVAAGIALAGAIVAAVLVRPHEREEHPADAQLSEIAA